MKHGVQNEVGYAYSSNESKSYLITTLHLLFIWLSGSWWREERGPKRRTAQMGKKPEFCSFNTRLLSHMQRQVSQTGEEQEWRQPSKYKQKVKQYVLARKRNKNPN